MILDGYMPGDVLAFAGKGFISRAIQFFTWSNVSHVGVVDTHGRLVESTSLDGRLGVFSRRVEDAVEAYSRGASVYHLPLGEGYSAQLLRNVDMFQRYLDSIHKRAYDFRQAIRSAIPIFTSKGCDKRLFCSELVAYAHMSAGLYMCNPSEVTPANLMSFSIYDEAYILLTPNAPLLKRYNSVDPNSFGIRSWNIR